MAIQKCIRIVLWGMADGTSTSFTVNLDTGGTPYLVGQARPGGQGGQVINWFASPLKGADPTGVKVITGATSATLVGKLITVNVPVQPIGDKYEVVLDLLFA